MKYFVKWVDVKDIKYCRAFEDVGDTAEFVVGLFNYKDIVKIDVFDESGNLVDVFEEEEL